MSSLTNHAHLSAAVSRYNASPEMERYLQRIMKAESDGDRYAANPNSSARGIFQFLDGTWKQYGKGRDIFDPEAQCDAVVRFALDNEKTLMQAMHSPLTAGEYYLAHFAGPNGAVTVLQADPETPISGLLGGAVMKANASITFQGKKFAEFTAGDLRDWTESKMSGKLVARDRYADWSVHESGIDGESREDEIRRRRKFLNENNIPDMTNVEALLGAMFFAIISSFLDKPAAKESAPEVPNGTHVTPPPVPARAQVDAAAPVAAR